MIAPVCGFLISTSMTKLKFYTVQLGCTFWLTVTFVVFGSFWTFWCLCDCAKMVLLAHITFPNKHSNATFSVSTRVPVSFLRCLQLPFHTFLCSPPSLTRSDPRPHLGTHNPPMFESDTCNCECMRVYASQTCKHASMPSIIWAAGAAASAACCLAGSH